MKRDNVGQPFLQTPSPPAAQQTSAFRGAFFFCFAVVPTIGNAFSGCGAFPRPETLFVSITIRYMKAWLVALLWVFPLAVGAEVYRCGNSYSSSPCSGARRVDVAPAVSAGPNRSTVPIHLCKAYSGGGRFWTSGRCSDHNGTIDRVVNVPRGMSWEHQVEIAKNALRAGDALANPPALPRSSSIVQDDSAQRCKYLAERIEWLDGAARLGGVASYMDWLSAERRRARDEQFRLRCR